MDSNYLTNFIVYITSFVVSFLALSVIDYSKFTRKKSPEWIYLLHFVLATGLATLVANFLLAIML